MTQDRKRRSAELVPLQSFTASEDDTVEQIRKLNLYMTVDVRVNHLTVKVRITLTNTVLHGLVNSDVTVNFILIRFMKKHNLTLQKLYAPAVKEVNNKILMKETMSEYYEITIKVDIIADTSLFCILDLLRYNIIMSLS